jgi:ABC-type branched-subunit amino acid transport system substrate-binding protein
VVASLSVRVYTGSAAGTQSAAQTGIDLESADNALNSPANRSAFPITVGTNSFEKWLKLFVDAAPANGVTNFKIWGDGAVQTSTTLNFTGAYITGVTPVATASTIANANFNTFTTNNKATWDTTAYTATNATTKYAVFQLVVDATCGPGNWGTETISYSYDET